ncbi:MAG: peptidylprolyl isomerase [Clostridiales bacterium 43-6]|nr:MAG: peptidylprolyl isomerase [Clostridiales bacterium 43-6]
MSNFQLAAPAKGDTVVSMKTTLGDIKIKLFPTEAPKTVENFLTHSKNGYYNGLIFHRVIKDFMIQGGDPTGTGMGGESIWGPKFEDECSVLLRNYKGALSMANAGPNTNGSQFFIVDASTVPAQMLGQMESLKDDGFPAEVTENYKKLGGTPWLDFKHTVFGQVVEGLDVVAKIASVPVGRNDKPDEDVKILSIEVIEE